MAFANDELRHQICDFKSMYEVYLLNHCLPLTSCIKKYLYSKNITNKTTNFILKARE